MAVEWNDVRFGRGPFVPKVTDSPIRARMLEVLLQAGEKGASAKEFANCGWQDDFNTLKLYKAMGYLSKRNGYKLQFQGRRAGDEYPTRWRVVR